MTHPSAGSESPDLTARIDALFADIKSEESPGCALAVMRGGEIIHARGYGLADLEHQIPITPGSVFDIGSTSKQFTAACIVLLALDGRLTLDDPVRLHIAELPDYGAPLTLRHLLHHTGGVRDYLTLMELVDLRYENDYPEERITALLTRQRELDFTPGEEHLYSNSGYFLLGEVVRRVSGRSLAQFAHERIFEPLGMTDTHFHDNWRRLVPRRAQGYRPGPEGGYELDISLFDVVGDGMVYSTILDLARWTQIFTDPTPLGGQAFLDMMLTVGTLNDGTTLKYAAGLFVDGEQVFHGGTWVGYRAALLMVPGEALSVICLSNLASFVPMGQAQEVLDAVQDKSLKSESALPTADPEDTVSLSPAQQEKLIGQYWSPQSGGVWTVAASPEGLTVETFGRVLLMSVLSPDTFSLPAPFPAGNRLVFEPTAGTVRFTSSLGMPDVLKRSTPPTPDDTALQAYAGQYVSEELDVTWHFIAETGRLVLRGHSMLGGTWNPLAPGVFWNSSVVADFSQATPGGQPVLTVLTGRVKHLRFQKIP